MPNLISKGSDDSLSLESAINLLLDLGIQRKKIQIIAKGGFQRYQGAIIQQVPDAGTPVVPESEVLITVTEVGLYDILPDGFFSSNGALDKEQMELEKGMRNFFGTFDSLLFLTSATLEYIKDVSNLIFYDETLCKSFLHYFGFSSQEWEEKDLLIWRTIMPYAPLWVGTKKGIEMITNTFFGLQTKVIENVSHVNEIPSEYRNRLGAEPFTLGKDSLIGNSFEENYTTFRLLLGPVPLEQFPEFLPEKKLRKKMERILEFAIPGNMSYEIHLILFEEDQKFVPEKNPVNNILGYSTFLG
jgi:predicted component of type VI protein secretion system